MLKIVRQMHVHRRTNSPNKNELKILRDAYQQRCTDDKPVRRWLNTPDATRGLQSQQQDTAPHLAGRMHRSGKLLTVVPGSSCAQPWECRVLLCLGRQFLVDLNILFL